MSADTLQTDTFLYRRQVSAFAYERIEYASMPTSPDPYVVHMLFQAKERAKMAHVLGDTARDARRCRVLWLLPCPHQGVRDCASVGRMQETLFQCDASLDSAFVDVFPVCKCATAPKLESEKKVM